MTGIDLSPGPPTAPAAALRRRAWFIVSLCTTVNLFVLLGLWQEWFSTGTGASLVVLVIAVSGVVVLTAMEPFRRQELRENVGKEPGPPRRVLLLLLAVTVPTVPVMHFTSGEPWRVSIARAVAILVYFGVFMTLARLQRHGVQPYLRPAWYGFLLAGVAGALAFILVAGADPADLIIHGFTWSLMHYGWVRLATRGAPRIAAEQPVEG